MKHEDLTRFAMAIGKLCVAYNRVADKALVEVYREVLADKRIEDIEAGVRKILGGTGEFMPPPGVVKKRAFQAACERQGVAFIEGTGWISTIGNNERGEHPDYLDKLDERKALEAAKVTPLLRPVKP